MDLKEEVAFSTFLAQAGAQSQSLQSEICEWGIEMPSELFQVQEQLSREMATKIFKSILECAHAKKAKEAANQEKLKMEKAQVVDAAASLNPAEVIREQMVQVYHEELNKGKGNGKINGKGKGKETWAAKDKPPRFDSKNFTVNWFGGNERNGAYDIEEKKWLPSSKKKSRSKRKWTKKQLAERKIRDEGYKTKNWGSPGAGLGWQAERPTKGLGKTPKGKGKGKSKGLGKGKGAKKGKTGQNDGGKGYWNGGNGGNNGKNQKKAKGKGGTKGW